MPQFVAFELRFTSQPLAALPSQSANPMLHAAIPQVPFVQPGDPFGGVGHWLPQLPQLLTSVFLLTSQPLPTIWSQLRNPALQTIPHVPLLQVDVPFARVGQAEQLPQWLGLV
jgi:hypothetical protein